MKTLKIALLIGTIIFASCSDKEEEPAPVGPSLSYNETNFETTIGSKGNSGLPALNWNGEIGTLSLSGSQQGIYIDDYNGTLHWSQHLKPGTTTVTAVATNAIGQTTVELEIENKFMGKFEGGFNLTPNSTVLVTDISMDYKEDGTMIANVGFNGVGSWTRDESTVNAVVSFDGDVTFVTFEGNVNTQSSQTKVQGFLYSGQQAIEANKIGYFSVNLD